MFIETDLSSKFDVCIVIKELPFWIGSVTGR